MFNIPTILSASISMGGYYGGGGGYGGYDTGDFSDNQGLFSSVKALLDTLPTPVSTLIIGAVVIGGAALIGLILGRLFANIFYPDPEKPSIFSRNQKLLFLGSFCMAFGVIIFSLTYQPKNLGEAVNVDNFGEEDFSNGEYDENNPYGDMDGNYDGEFEQNFQDFEDTEGLADTLDPEVNVTPPIKPGTGNPLTREAVTFG